MRLSVTPQHPRSVGTPSGDRARSRSRAAGSWGATARSGPASASPRSAPSLQRAAPAPLSPCQIISGKPFLSHGGLFQRGSSRHIGQEFAARRCRDVGGRYISGARAAAPTHPYPPVYWGACPRSRSVRALAISPSIRSSKPTALLPQCCPERQCTARNDAEVQHLHRFGM
jgi:hypothetical protein